MTRQERNAILAYSLVGTIASGLFGFTRHPAALVLAVLFTTLAWFGVFIIATDERRRRRNR